MVIEILAVCIYAKIKHYKLKYLFRCWAFYPVLLMQLILILFNASIFFGTYYFTRFAPYIEPAIILSFLFPVLFLKIYKPAAVGAVFIAAGSALNRFVIAQNGGVMPVFPSLSYITGYTRLEDLGTVDTLHHLGMESVKFKFLTDYIDVGYSVLSPGDVLIHMFTVIMLYFMIKAVNLTAASIH